MKGAPPGPAPYLLGSLSTAEEDGRQILCKGFVEPMGNMGEGQGQFDGAYVQGNGQGGVVDANGCICDNEEKLVRGKLKTIGEAFLTHPIEFARVTCQRICNIKFCTFCLIRVPAMSRKCLM